MARGHPAKRGSVLDSLRSAGDDLVSIGEGETVGFNQHRNTRGAPFGSFRVPIDGVPIPYTLTDYGRAYLAELRAREAQVALGAAAHPNTETLKPRQ